MNPRSSTACVRMLMVVLTAAASPDGATAHSAPSAAPSRSATASQKSFDVFADALAADWMRADPLAATTRK